MKTWISIPLAVVIALTGFPHAFCACGCGGLAALIPTDDDEPACPSCGNHHSDSAPDDSSAPCTCRICKVIDAVSLPPAASVPAQEDVGSARLTQVSFLMEPAPPLLPGTCDRTEPPGHFMGSHCALTILLGHLLL